MAYPNYTTLPQYANILHLWKLDETSGTRSDFIATCHLTDNNTVLYGTGKIGNGADFKKDNSEYLSATSDSSADMEFTDGNFSVSFWIKGESSGVSPTILCKKISTNGWYIQFPSASDFWYLVLYNTTPTTVKSNTGLWSNGVWKHITVVRNGTTGYIYVDGSDETSASDTLVSPGTPNAPLYIGAYDGLGANYFLDGLLDELTIWNIALSSAEVSTLYNWYSKAGFSGAISFTGTAKPKPKITLIGAISFIGTLLSAITYSKVLSGAISFVGSLTSAVTYQKILNGTISFIGTLQTKTKKTLTGAITFTGNLNLKLKKTLTGAISFIGRFLHPYLDGIWSLSSKRTTTWTEQSKETTSWTGQSKEDTDWTTT